MGRWARNRAAEGLAAPLGVRAARDTVALDLHESAHGPHALLAGTTGSGKSELLQSLIRQVAEESKKFTNLTSPPLILTSQVMRIHFYHLIEQFYPNIRVLSFNEVASNVQIQAIGSLRLEEDMEEKGTA